MTTYHKYHISFLSNLNSKLNCINEQLDNDVNFNKPVKDKTNVVITKICKKCSKQDAEYCKKCGDDGGYDRFLDLRNTISNMNDINIVIDRDESNEPVPELIPEPVPEPVPEPNYDPVVIPEPEPVVIPEPVPEPEPVVVPEPEPVVVPELELEPEPEPELEPEPEPELEPVVIPELEPILEPEPEPVVIPKPEPVPELELIPEPDLDEFPHMIELVPNPDLLTNAIEIYSPIITDTAINNQLKEMEQKLKTNPPTLLPLIPTTELNHPNNNNNNNKNKHKNKNKK